jgi:hypothetical protein
MRLRRTGADRGQRYALPTAEPFAHMPTAFNNVRGRPTDKHPAGNIPP